MSTTERMPDSASTNTCPRCGAAFTCGMAAGWPACWCAALPAGLAVPAADAGLGCYCPECLQEMLKRAASGRCAAADNTG
ncbi:cysteine-rich CWC family protein [Pseudothauera hydrothermalis]|uniref:cysteine-rich CWC family protein n=1 Tax=Pseudothauera hydrothermalis TaxID=2184083 RepID=UPI0026CBD9A9